MESHLAEDASLRESLREMEGLVALLRDLPGPELPPAFSTRVIARIEDEGSQAPGRVRLWIQRLFEPAVTVPLAAGITAVALVVGAQQHTDEPGTELVMSAPQVAALPPREPDRRLASMSNNGSEVSLTEIQQRTLQTILSRHQDHGLARLLRGSGHPHAASFASQVMESDHNLQVVSLERQRPRR